MPGLSYAIVAARANGTGTNCQETGAESGCAAVGTVVAAELVTGVEVGAAGVVDTAESACELGKTGDITSAETLSLNPAAEPFRPGAGAEAEGQWADAAHEERQKFSNWISQMLADVAAEAGVRTAVVVVYVWCCLQADSSEVTEEDTGGRLGSILAAGVVADTGATVRGLGRKHVHSARDVRGIAETVRIEGAGGTVEIDTVGDLGMTGPLNGTMDGAMVFYDCAESVMSVVPVCEEMDMGFHFPDSSGWR